MKAYVQYGTERVAVSVRSKPIANRGWRIETAFRIFHFGNWRRVYRTPKGALYVVCGRTNLAVFFEESSSNEGTSNES